MKHTRIHELYTDPVAYDAAGILLSEDFHHISYALFRTDTRLGEVIATRFPDRSLVRPGVLLQSAMAMSDEAVAYLLRFDHKAAPLFVWTRVGLGILSKCYDLPAGLGLFLHMHLRPEAGARLLRNGALGWESGASFTLSRAIRATAPVKDNDRLTADDAASFGALLDAWRMAERFEQGILSTDENQTVTVRALGEALAELAAFAGCRFQVESVLADAYPLKCFRPSITEALLLAIFSEVREHGLTRHVICRIGYLEAPDGDRMSLRLDYDIDPEHLPVRTRQILMRTRGYLTHVAEVAGVSLHFPPLAIPQECRRTSACLPRHGVYLEWETNPLVLASSDLKVGLHLSPSPSDAEWQEIEAFEWSEERARREAEERSARP